SVALWLVAHSNGAVIALLAARILIERGYTIAGLILTGAAVQADVQQNRILEWQKAGKLGDAIAYSSQDDEVLDGDSADQSRDTRYSLLDTFREWLWGKLMFP